MAHWDPGKWESLPRTAVLRHPPCATSSHTHYPLRRRTKAGVHIRSHPSLRHSEKGAVSLARSGADFLWAFNRALHLDETHAVVGRVTEASLLLLDRLNGSATQPDDSPTSRVAVARCGLTDAAGSVELAGPGPEGAPTDETPEAARTRLAREAEAARLGLRQARKGGVRKGEEGEFVRAGRRVAAWQAVCALRGGAVAMLCGGGMEFHAHHLGVNDAAAIPYRSPVPLINPGKLWPRD